MNKDTEWDYRSDAFTGFKRTGRWGPGQAKILRALMEIH